MFLTRPQRCSLHRVWLSTQEPHVPLSQRLPYRAFRRRVRPEFGGYGAIMIHRGDIWLGIERDGYTHS